MSTRMCIICCSELINGYYAGHKVTATTLADKFGLNIRTLNPSLNKMKNKGILKSQVGGIDRGYIFARDPHEISVCEVIEAVEGFGYMPNYTDFINGAKCSNKDCEHCHLHQASKVVIDFAKEQYKNISIFDLFENKITLDSDKCCNQ
ncbi:MAG: Rrf2 family transcriptional regulator [Rikenellaceae bacterium]